MASKNDGGGNGNTIKIIIAVVGLLGAAILLGWQFGVFDRFTEKPLVAPKYTAEQEQAQKKQVEKAKKQAETQPPSGS